jgi:exosome complex exonuclease RRP6
MRKPQLDFADPVDNSNDRPAFTPTLPVKHHAMVPLDFVPPKDYILPDDPEEAKTRLRREKEWRRHPYFYETRHLPYPTSMFTVGPVIKPAPIETTEAIWVDQPEQLAEMVEELKQAKEIGVDLEHHDTHSYYGFTCLMQISTREKDWLIDTLALRAALREHKLGGVMADPSIVKVGLHTVKIADHRCFMAQTLILYGCRRTSTSTWSICSTHTTPPKCSTFGHTASPTSWRCTAAITRTRSTRWPIGV